MTCQIVIDYLDRFIPIELPGGSKMANRKERQMRSNPIRDAIMDLPEGSPITVCAVSEQLQIDCETVAYHLRALAKAGLLFKRA
jgi:predicted transcriptional regulator